MNKRKLNNLLTLLRYLYQWCFLCGFVYLMLKWLCDGYASKMKQTGGIVLARDLVMYEYTPITVTFFLFIVGIVFAFKK